MEKCSQIFKTAKFISLPAIIGITFENNKNLLTKVTWNVIDANGHIIYKSLNIVLFYIIVLLILNIVNASYNRY